MDIYTCRILHVLTLSICALYGRLFLQVVSFIFFLLVFYFSQAITLWYHVVFVFGAYLSFMSVQSSQGFKIVCLFSLVNYYSIHLFIPWLHQVPLSNSGNLAFVLGKICGEVMVSLIPERIISWQEDIEETGERESREPNAQHWEQSWLLIFSQVTKPSL